MAPAVAPANTVVWEESQSAFDVTNYAALPAQYYWFANFANPSAVTGAGMDGNEVRNLPSWIHFETRPAFKGFADDGVTADSTAMTGYSITETGLGGGSSSIGGQPGFNDLTLPNGAFGRSGQAVDTGSGTGTTTQMAALRIDAGAPSALRIWVVLDNGADPNFHTQQRIRVNLRDTVGPPGYADAAAPPSSEAEALPGGSRLAGQAGSDARATNGVADIWSFMVTGVNANDRLNIRPTSLGLDNGAFAGFMIQVIPEPASIALAGLAGIAGIAFRRRFSA
jgi:hypothetical protein